MRALVLATLAVTLVAPGALAAPWAVGDTVAPVVLEDQHGAPGGVDARTRLLVLSRDMDAGDAVKAALAETRQAALDARGAVYVADISRMPALVSRLMAVPRMRRRPYRVFLDRDGTVLRDVPGIAGRATIVSLDGLRVTGIAHAATAAEVRAALDAPR